MIPTSDSSAEPASPKPSAVRTRFLDWLRGPTFARDIVVVLAIKLVLLLALKYAFFNHPQAENMSMPSAEVARAILSVPARAMPQGDRNAH